MQPKVSVMLWYEGDAEAAVNHYVKAFTDGRVSRTEVYPENAMGPAGSVMTVDFELAGQRFTALNAGPMFKPTEATSIVVRCDDQAEVDRLWDHLSEGGSTSMCGWLKDRWGFSWQITPRQLFEAMESGDAAKKARVFAAMLEMTKFDVAKIEAAAKG